MKKIEREIEGIMFTLFKDYDKNNLCKLSYEGRIKWFEHRVYLILINPVEILFNEFKKNPTCRSLETEDSTFVLIATTSICAGIEAAGGFFTGNFSSGSFKEFVNKYMHEDYRKKCYKGKPYLSILRKNFRNGLSHGFTIKDGGVEIELKDYFEEKPYGLEINPVMLFEDFKNAFDKYINDLRTEGEKSEIGKNFRKIFDKIYLK